MNMPSRTKLFKIIFLIIFGLIGSEGLSAAETKSETNAAESYDLANSSSKPLTYSRVGGLTDSEIRKMKESNPLGEGMNSEEKRRLSKFNTELSGFLSDLFFESKEASGSTFASIASDMFSNLVLDLVAYSAIDENAPSWKKVSGLGKVIIVDGLYSLGYKTRDKWFPWLYNTKYGGKIAEYAMGKTTAIGASVLSKYFKRIGDDSINKEVEILTHVLSWKYADRIVAGGPNNLFASAKWVANRVMGTLIRGRKGLRGKTLTKFIYNQGQEFATYAWGGSPIGG